MIIFSILKVFIKKIRQLIFEIFEIYSECEISTLENFKFYHHKQLKNWKSINC